MSEAFLAAPFRIHSPAVQERVRNGFEINFFDHSSAVKVRGVWVESGTIREGSEAAVFCEAERKRVEAQRATAKRLVGEWTAAHRPMLSPAACDDLVERIVKGMKDFVVENK